MGASDVSILPQRTVILPTTVFQAGAATDIPLVLQGAASQTGNLTEWRNNSGTVLASVDQNGYLRTFSGLFSQTQSATTSGLVIRGSTSQTANLQEWQNSAGTALAKIQNDGAFIYGTSYLSPNTGAAGAHIEPNIAGLAALVVKGLASQTGNLQEWQNSGGTILTKVDSSGNIFAPGVIAGTSTGMNAAFTAGATTTSQVAFATRSMNGQTGDFMQIQSYDGGVRLGVKNTGQVYTSTITGLGTNLNDQSTWLELSGTNNNGAYLRFRQRRTTQGGSSWDTAAYDILRVTDATEQHRISFMGDGGIEYWTNSSTATHNFMNGRIFVATPSAAIAANRIQAGSPAAGNGTLPDLAVGGGTGAGVPSGAYSSWLKFGGPAIADGDLTWQPIDKILRFRSSTAAAFDSTLNLYATSFNSTSTLDSKTNVVPLTVSHPMTLSHAGRSHDRAITERIHELRPVSYTPKGGVEGHILHSFVAEDAAETMPEIVGFSADGKPEGINITSSVAVLFSLVQHLMVEVTELKKGK